MRRAIAIVFSAILVTIPIKVAQAQVAPTDSSRTQNPTRIGVPVVEPGSGAALLFTAGTLARDAIPLSPPSRRASTAHKVVRAAGFLMGLVRAVGVWARDHPPLTFSGRPLLRGAFNGT